MNRFCAFLLGLTLCATALAQTQWEWIDQGGRRVFSDQAPPPHVPPDKVIKQPGARRLPLAAPAPAAPAVEPSQALGRDKALEEKRRQAEAAEVRKQKSEKERIAKQRAENCDRVRRAKATLDSGIRLARVNDKGEREVLDDAARAAEGKRLDDLIASECAPS